MDGGSSAPSGFGSALLRSRARGGRRLVRPERVVAVLLVAAAGALVAGLIAWRVDKTKDDDSGLDSVLESIIDTIAPMRHGAARWLGEVVADVGSPPSTAVLMLAAGAVAFWWFGPRALALVLVGPPIAMITTTTILKPLIGRTRGDELAYPSGHTTSVTSIAVAVAIMVLSSSLLSSKWRRIVLGGLAALCTAVAVALVGRDYHYPTDTLGAAGVAIAVVLVSAVIIDAMADSLAEDDVDLAELDRPVGADDPAAPLPTGSAER